MKKDIAVEEIRSVRHRISERYGHDTQALLKHYKEMEKRLAGRVLKCSGADVKHNSVP
ncbi:MAG: hypothetical protein HY706_19065 [Candidatus Hydrogenedentes bacterium]|nr:hypothetical protein [Candidatus Hydrogenedentota bacterium]